MHFQVKMPENGRNKIFNDKQTTSKVCLMFGDVRVLTQMYQLCFCTRSKNKEGTMYLALKSLKYAVKKVNNGQKAKSKVQIMFFEVKMRG